jgi:predicted transcriptional regulator
MALEGTIKDFGLPDIFQLIGLQRKTGILTLKSEKENVTVTFENGMVVMADSSAKRLEDRLGSVLVKQGKLAKDKLEEALQTQKATLQRLGHILITQNYITGKDLKDAIQVQVSQIVFKVFRWREGEYHFAPTESVDYDRENFNPMSADFILMEGIRMVDEWPIIEKKIPSMDIVLRSVVDPSMIEVGGEEEVEDAFGGLGGDAKRSAASSTNKIRLTPEEEKIYRKVDGTRTVQAIIDATGLAEFEVCRTLYDLLNRNIISTIGRGASKEAVAAGRIETSASAAPGYAVLAVIGALAFVGLAAHLKAPFAVVGLPPLLQGSYEMLLEGVSRSRLERLDRAIRAYHLAHGSVPRTLEDVVGDGLVDRSYLKDPWGRPYHFALTNNGYLLNAVDDRDKTIRETVIERVLPADRP